MSPIANGRADGHMASSTEGRVGTPYGAEPYSTPHNAATCPVAQSDDAAPCGTERHVDATLLVAPVVTHLAASFYSWQASSGWCVGLLLLIGAAQ